MKYCRHLVMTAALAVLMAPVADAALIVDDDLNNGGTDSGGLEAAWGASSSGSIASTPINSNNGVVMANNQRMHGDFDEVTLAVGDTIELRANVRTSGTGDTNDYYFGLLDGTDGGGYAFGFGGPNDRPGKMHVLNGGATVINGGSSSSTNKSVGLGSANTNYTASLLIEVLSPTQVRLTATIDEGLSGEETYTETTNTVYTTFNRIGLFNRRLANDYGDDFEVDFVQAIPEPASLALLGLGSLIMLSGRSRRRAG